MKIQEVLNNIAKSCKFLCILYVSDFEEIENNLHSYKNVEIVQFHLHKYKEKHYKKYLLLKPTFNKKISNLIMNQRFLMGVSHFVILFYPPYGKGLMVLINKGFYCLNLLQISKNLFFILKDEKDKNKLLKITKLIIKIGENIIILKLFNIVFETIVSQMYNLETGKINNIKDKENYLKEEILPKHEKNLQVYFYVAISVLVSLLAFSHFSQAKTIINDSNQDKNANKKTLGDIKLNENTLALEKGTVPTVNFCPNVYLIPEKKDLDGIVKDVIMDAGKGTKFGIKGAMVMVAALPFFPAIMILTPVFLPFIILERFKEIAEYTPDK